MEERPWKPKSQARDLALSHHLKLTVSRPTIAYQMFLSVSALRLAALCTPRQFSRANLTPPGHQVCCHHESSSLIGRLSDFHICFMGLNKKKQVYHRYLNTDCAQISEFRSYTTKHTSLKNDH